MGLFRRPPRPADASSKADGRVPDPALPPRDRGSWEEAALANVAVTEIVKRNIRSVTRPWNK